MPQMQDIKEDRLLTGLANEFGPTGHIADQALPPVSVKSRFGRFWNYDKSRFNAPQAKRVPRSRYKEIEWGATQDTFFAEQYGLESRIADEEREESTLPFDLDETTGEILTENLLNDREIRVAALMTNPTYVTQNVTLSGTGQFNDYTNSDPMGVVKTARGVVRAVGGTPFNTLLMGYEVAEQLLYHPDIKAENDDKNATYDDLKRIFRVEEVIVGSVLYTTSKKGQTVTLGDVWGKHMLLYYKNPRPTLKRPSFGYQMVVKRLQGFRWRDVSTDSDVLRVSETRAEKLVSTQLGYLVINAVA